MNIEVRIYDEHGWSSWFEVSTPFVMGFSMRKYSNFQIREKPMFEPGWFQDMSMSEHWDAHEEQGRIIWATKEPGPYWQRIKEVVYAYDDED